MGPQPGLGPLAALGPLDEELLPKAAALFSGSKPAFPQFAHEAGSSVRLLAVSQVCVWF